MRKLSEPGGDVPPFLIIFFDYFSKIWAHLDLNQGPTDYEHTKRSHLYTKCSIKQKIPVVNKGQAGSGDTQDENMAHFVAQ